MTKEVFFKLHAPGGHLEAKDLTADEKKDLYALMVSFGATAALAYNRFFDKGFDRWELQGINQCKADFVAEHVEDEELRKTLYAKDEGFYSALPFMSGLRMKLVEHMAARGMIHRKTVDQRFDADDWKEWERVGVDFIIDKFCDMYAKKEETA